MSRHKGSENNGLTERTKGSLPRLMISLTPEVGEGEVRVSLEAFLHFANELAFDLEELEDDARARRRASARTELGTSTLKLLL